ncbi:MAG: DUF1223 domain-containing protein [Rhizobiaceae bacterium]|nr:DUF1223 domain-containing protein [Rhizobiaceae bacterium]MCV0404648.1 DUF1223 domain-containing protein [Rhizobiaceae bacterium]
MGLVAPAICGERPKAVVELFTSQGCSSCPPADANLRRIIDAGDVIALAYHIDYWDYLGWKDTLASAANTDRQRYYAKALGSRSVYTPQAVVNGRVHLNGAAKSRLDMTIERMASGDQALSVDVEIRRDGDTIAISTGDWPNGHIKAHVLLVVYKPVTAVEVKRGENAGRTLEYRNAVVRMQAAGMWKGKPAQWEIPASEIGEGNGAAVLIQAMRKDGAPGPVLGAAALEPAALAN